MAHFVPPRLLLAVFAGLLPAPAAHAQWVTGGIPVCVAPNTQDGAGVVSDGAGGALVFWVDPRSGGKDVYAQRLTPGGQVYPGWPLNGVFLSGEAGGYPPLGIPDGSGGAILVWEDTRAIQANLHDIYAQRITGAGVIAAGWPADGLPVCALPGDQTAPQLIPDGEGGAIIVWDDGREDPRNFFFIDDIYALRVTGDGAIAPGWQENGTLICSAPDAQFNPTLVSDEAGGAIINWFDFRDGLDERSLIYAQRIDGSGSLAPGWPVDGIPICRSPKDQVEQRSVEDGQGGAIILWKDFRSDVNGDVYAQRITGTGAIAPGWPAEGVALSTSFGTQQDLSAAADGFGGAIVAWEDYTTPTRSDIFAQRVTAEGTIAPGWPAQGFPVCAAPSFQLNPKLATDGAGGAYVTWEDTRSGQTPDVYAQHVTALGTIAPGWLPDGHGVCTEIASGPRPAIASDGRGGAYVAWADLRFGTKDIFAHRLALDGPVPVLLSLAESEASSARIVLTWHGHGASELEAFVERRTDPSGWESLGLAEVVGSDRLRFEDASVLPGVRYAYRLVSREGTALTSENWVEAQAIALSLSGFTPNPARGRPAIRLSLPDESEASLALFDVRGRMVASREVGSLGPGSHLVELDPGEELEAGIYWLRLTHGGRSVTARGVVVR